MVRMQVQLTEEQVKTLRWVSRELGRSMADLVREGVSLYLESRRGPDREELVRRGLSVVGRFSAGPGDAGRNHDRYLAEDSET